MTQTEYPKKMVELAEAFVRNAKNRDKHPEWSIGQIFFISLLETDKELAEKIRGTDEDPSNIDPIGNDNAFFKRIREEYGLDENKTYVYKYKYQNED
jgi:hypothetical protein